MAQRKGKRQDTIATVPVGYADGLNVSWETATGILSYTLKRLPLIGNICMDMTMVDISGMEAREGDEVILFGDSYPVSIMAEQLGTIPMRSLPGYRRV